MSVFLDKDVNYISERKQLLITDDCFADISICINKKKVKLVILIKNINKINYIFYLQEVI